MDDAQGKARCVASPHDSHQQDLSNDCSSSGQPCLAVGVAQTATRTALRLCSSVCPFARDLNVTTKRDRCFAKGWGAGWDFVFLKAAQPQSIPAAKPLVENADRHRRTQNTKRHARKKDLFLGNQMLKENQGTVLRGPQRCRLDQSF